MQRFWTPIELLKRPKRLGKGLTRWAALHKNIWRILNIIASIWLQKHALLFVLGHNLFIEDHSFFSNFALVKLFMSAGKFQCTFPPQIIGGYFLSKVLNLVPRGRDPSGLRQESRPLATPNFWAYPEYSLYAFSRIKLVRFDNESADFRCWSRTEVLIPGAHQKDRGLWGRQC